MILQLTVIVAVMSMFMCEPVASLDGSDEDYHPSGLNLPKTTIKKEDSQIQELEKILKTFEEIIKANQLEIKKLKKKNNMLKGAQGHQTSKILKAYDELLKKHEALKLFYKGENQALRTENSDLKKQIEALQKKQSQKNSCNLI